MPEEVEWDDDELEAMEAAVDEAGDKKPGRGKKKNGDEDDKGNEAPPQPE